MRTNLGRYMIGAAFLILGLWCQAGSMIIQLTPRNIGSSPVRVHTTNIDFGVRFTVFYPTNENTRNQFLHGNLTVADEDHQIASSAVDKLPASNGVEFVFTIAPAYLEASRFDLIDQAHVGKEPMPAFTSRWFYLHDFANNHSTPIPLDSSPVAPDIIKALPQRIQDLPPGTSPENVWQQLGLTAYKNRLGGYAFPEKEERYWLSWNYEIELLYTNKPSSSGGLAAPQLLRATLYKNGREVSQTKLTTRSSWLDSETLTSWGPQKDFFLSKQFEIIPWEKAKALLLDHKIIGGKQYHTGWLTLYEATGEKFLTRQPEQQDIYKFATEHKLELKGFGTE